MDTKVHENLLHKELSYQIQGASMEVRKHFGPGHKEVIYQNALAEEFKARGVPFEKEPPIKIYSPKTKIFVGLYRPDFVVDDKVLVEIKAVRVIPKLFLNQLYDYLRNSHYELGYLINFASPQLYLKRIIFTNDRKHFLGRHEILRTATRRFTQVFVSFSLLFVLFRVFPASAATLLVVPERERIAVGETVSFKVGLDAQSEAINMVDLRLLIPEGLEGVRVDTSGSPVQFWLQAPKVDAVSKVVAGIGGVAGGGLTGKTVLFNLALRARSAGTFEVVPDGSSRLYLADGQGTEITPHLSGGRIAVLSAGEGSAVPIRSSTHPDENQWYALRRAEVSWQSYPDRVVNFMVDRDPAGVPDEVPDEVKLPIVLDNLSEGMHFVHVREGRFGAQGMAWSEPSHFRIMIDGTPPEQFEPVLGQERGVHGGKPFVAFSTTDKVSGLWYYTVRERPAPTMLTELLFGEEEVRTADTSARLEHSKLFRVFGGEVVIAAYDQAENLRESRIALARQPWLLEAGIAIPVLLGVLIWIIVRVARAALWRQPIDIR